jgi:hypothetical protein
MKIAIPIFLSLFFLPNSRSDAQETEKRIYIANDDMPFRNRFNCDGILATDVPSAGYKVFEIQPGPGTAPVDEAVIVSYWTFSFALNEPAVHTEEIGSINRLEFQP